jgi:hypothetical protein
MVCRCGEDCKQLANFALHRTAAVDAGSYHHPHFVRGWPRLAERIERVKIKGSGDPIFPPDPSAQDPNFYHYNPLPHSTGGIPWRPSIGAAMQQTRVQAPWTQESAILQSLREQQNQSIAYQQRVQVAQPSRSFLPRLALPNVASPRGTENVLALSAVEHGNAANFSSGTNSLILPPLLPPTLDVESAMRYFTLQATQNNLGPGNLHSLPGPMLSSSSQFPHVGDHIHAFTSFPAAAGRSPVEAPAASFIQALREEQVRRLLYGSQSPLDATSEIASLIARNRLYDYRASARTVQPRPQLPGEHGSQSHSESDGRSTETGPR